MNLVDLADIEIPNTKVFIGDGQYLVVYGLPYHQLIKLFKDVSSYLDNVLDGKDGAVDELITEQPEAVAKMIAIACNSDNLAAIEKAKRLPAQVQGTILSAIFRLTFPDPELLGKFWADLEATMLAVMKATVAQRSALHSGANYSTTK